jgi:hypothetical protein
VGHAPGELVETAEVDVPVARDPATDPSLWRALRELETTLAFPNPFAGSTTIAYRTPRADVVSIAIYDVAGGRVRTLGKNVPVAAGVHVLEWDGRNDRGHRVDNGVFYYRIEGESVDYRRALAILR